jgi:hypothetical protein
VIKTLVGESSGNVTVAAARRVSWSLAVLSLRRDDFAATVDATQTLVPPCEWSMNNRALVAVLMKSSRCSPLIRMKVEGGNASV